jgi:Flp pilus assembly protein TadG
MSENGTVTATDETNQANVDATNNETTQNNETAQTAGNIEESTENATAENTEDVSYHTVEKEGNVTAIWEMQGRRHLRTIDPRSSEGKQILELFETAA